MTITFYRGRRLPQSNDDQTRSRHGLVFPLLGTQKTRSSKHRCAGKLSRSITLMEWTAGFCFLAFLFLNFVANPEPESASPNVNQRLARNRPRKQQNVCIGYSEA
jgi:hypothetical protein